MLPWQHPTRPPTIRDGLREFHGDDRLLRRRPNDASKAHAEFTQLTEAYEVQLRLRLTPRRHVIAPCHRKLTLIPVQKSYKDTGAHPSPITSLPPPGHCNFNFIAQSMQDAVAMRCQ